MTDAGKEAQPQDRGPYPSCPHCGDDLFLTFEIFDPGKSKKVQVFECQKCHRRIWEDQIA